MIRAWHFLNGNKLRDGTTAPPDGQWLTYDGPIVMCESGLHWSREPFDALQYAPGNTLCLVDVDGQIIEDKDKGVSSMRRIVVRMDAEPLLRYFARQQALSVVHLWDAPQVVFDYLMGDDAARAAARDAARAAAWDAAWAATRDAAWAAARDAARDATRVTALDAARAAAWAAARDAAWDAALDAARKYFNALVHDAFEDWL
jgi:hypothetical protein